MDDVKYGSPLGSYSSVMPPERDYFVFGGWYADEALSTPFAFSDETMPANNIQVYAKWNPIQYFVEIDPNGGVLDHSGDFAQYNPNTPVGGMNMATYFWPTRGSTIRKYDNVERTYVPDPNGEYVYINIKYDNEAHNWDWSYDLPASRRVAFYAPLRELDQIYDEYFSGYTVEINGVQTQKLPKTEFIENCVNSQRYRPLQENEYYTLVGWFKIDEEGNPEPMPYNFSEHVVAPVRLRAEWKLNGEFFIEYDPVMALGLLTIGSGNVTYDPVDPS